MTVICCTASAPCRPGRKPVAIEEARPVKPEDGHFVHCAYDHARKVPVKLVIDDIYGKDPARGTDVLKRPEITVEFEVYPAVAAPRVGALCYLPVFFG